MGIHLHRGAGPSKDNKTCLHGNWMDAIIASSIEHLCHLLYVYYIVCQSVNSTVTDSATRDDGLQHHCVITDTCELKAIGVLMFKYVGTELKMTVIG